MAQTRPSPTLSRGFTRLGRFLAPYDDALMRYNCIHRYALTVAMFAEQLR